MRIAQDIEVPLTAFADFACKTGDKKRAQAISIRGNLNTEYELVKDFYKRLREGIIELHKHGKGASALDAIARAAPDPKKRSCYPEVIRYYRRFIEGRQISWFDPPKDVWVFRNLAVKVNPELGLLFGGIRHVIKLYFKKAPLPEAHMHVMNQLMTAALQRNGKPSKFGVLDIRRDTFIEAESVEEEAISVIEREAVNLLRAFAEMSD